MSHIAIVCHTLRMPMGSTVGTVARRLIGVISLFAMLAAGCSEPSPQQSSGAEGDRGEVGNTSSAEDTTDGDPSVSLPQQQRQRIWDIEHRAFLMEAEVFPLFKSAFAAGDMTSVSHFLSPSCSVEIPNWQDDETTTRGCITFSAFGKAQASTVEQLTTLVLNLRKRFDQQTAPSVSLGLVRLGPLDIAGDLTGRWASEWKLQLTGMQSGEPVTESARLSLQLKTVTEQMAQDSEWIEQLTLHDLTITRSTHRLMAEITDSAGFDTDHMRDNWRPECRGDFRTRTGGLYACDYNRDGCIDFLVDDIALGRKLYRGGGDATFEDVTQEAGLGVTDEQAELLWTGAVWADFDGDGYEDLISESRLFRNRRNGTFEDVTESTNLRLTPSAGYAVADYDLDGRVDLYVCHTGPYMPGQTAKDAVPWIDGDLGVDNVLWRNTGEWQFEDVTSPTNSGAEGVTSFAAVWIDATADRRPDLFAINEFGRNCLLLNRGDEFESPDADESFGGFSMGVSAGDVDNDGDLDIYVANMYSKAGNRIISNVDPDSYADGLYNKLVEATLGSRLYLNDGQGRFVSQPSQSGLSDVGWAYGPAMGDFDSDGRLDIYATAGFRSVERGKPDG
jgi:FG-GAP-like repeat